MDPPPTTPEGYLCRYADRIAYLTHDVADAIRAGILGLSNVPPTALNRFGSTSREWINQMIRAVIDHTLASGTVGMDEETMAIMHDLRQFMFENVYLRPRPRSKNRRAILVIRNLIDYFVHHPDEVPEGTTVEGADPLTAAIDFVAGMTDRYAIQTHDRLFRPTLFD